MQQSRRSFVRNAALTGTALWLGGCYGKTTPIRTISYVPGSRRRRLIVMLPGFSDRAEAFGKHDMVQPALDSKLDADVIAVNAHFGYYRDGSVFTRVPEDVLAPARAAGYEEIWLCGISMGGFGTLYTASQSQPLVDGMFVMAPFLGRAKTIDAVRAGGGPGQWSRTDEQTGYEFDLWTWLSGYAKGEDRPRLLLGYGDEDDRDGSKKMLAEHLPESDVFVRPGGHQWKVWEPMWREMLATAETGAG